MAGYQRSKESRGGSSNSQSPQPQHPGMLGATPSVGTSNEAILDLCSEASLGASQKGMEQNGFDHPDALPLKICSEATSATSSDFLYGGEQQEADAVLTVQGLLTSVLGMRKGWSWAAMALDVGLQMDAAHAEGVRTKELIEQGKSGLDMLDAQLEQLVQRRTNTFNLFQTLSAGQEQYSNEQSKQLVSLLADIARQMRVIEEAKKVVQARLDQLEGAAESGGKV